MIKCVNCAALPVALAQLKNLIQKNEEEKQRTLVFCEDRLSLAAERTVCEAVEGTFLTSVYTFTRFLGEECGKPQNVLSKQGSAMAVRRIIEEQKDNLTLFRQLSAPASAQTVYDTIALLYSSRVSAEDVKKAASAGGLLGGKLGDLAIIYAEYQKYLDKNGLQDRNGYLKRLAPVIESSERVRGASVVFLGYQALTCTITECVRAAFASAKDVTGLFIGGKEDIYVNEAGPAFAAAATEFGGAEVSYESAGLAPEAEVLRRALFNPESYYFKKFATDRVLVYEANDAEAEYEFIAANIKKYVLGGMRYGDISVMTNDLAGRERTLARVFSRYRIPYYADRRIPLIEHPLCAFIFSYLNCALTGCRPQDADGVISSPFFPAEQRDRDVFRNYALRYAAYRGGVLKPPRAGLKESGLDTEAVERVQKIFISGYSQISKKSVGRDILGGLRAILEQFGVAGKLQKQCEEFKTSRPVQAAFGARALQGVLQVFAEAEALAGDLPPKELAKILKSGFTAMEISLIPPKADAVFVGDISATAGIGTKVVYAAGLTGDVPASGADSALLTDGEIARLEQMNLNISPKIRQVNLRTRETAGLNVCVFGEALRLSYSADGGAGRSEIVSYALAAFSTKSNAKLEPVNVKRLERSSAVLKYYASEKLPAIKQLTKLKGRPAEFAAVYSALQSRGFKEEADAALKKPANHGINCGRELYVTYNSVTPTALETYFACPYSAYMKQGLKVQEREEGAVRAVDTGNYVHAVLEELAPEVNGIEGMQQFAERAEEVAQKKLTVPPYSSLADAKSGEYTANALKEEAVKIACGMFEQLKNSSFKVSSTEKKCEVPLIYGVKVFGRIDRTDECGDMVRVIDYKTGTIDCSPEKYYTGAKLQLPLYLLAASEGKRAVGAYYFPASVTYREKEDGVFRLLGFMDASEEVVTASDSGVKPKQKSAYVEAYLNGRAVDRAMDRENFKYFIEYSRLVAGKGAEEMLSGNTSPSPAEKACEYCKLGGSCGFAPGRDGGERSAGSVNCAEIAGIARGEGGDGGQKTDK